MEHGTGWSHLSNCVQHRFRLPKNLTCVSSTSNWNREVRSGYFSCPQTDVFDQEAKDPRLNLLGLLPRLTDGRSAGAVCYIF